MNYAYDFKGYGVFTPDGKAQIANVDAHNREQERVEIEWLKTHPDNLFLYVKHPTSTQYETPQTGRIPETHWYVTTWLGTDVATHVFIGPRRNIGFGFHSYRRAVSCRIFGVLYHGWYMESSGNYCRLRKAKVQK